MSSINPKPDPVADPSPPSGLIHWNDRKRNGARAIVEQLRVSGLIGSAENLVIGNPGSGEECLYLELNTEVRMALAEAAVGNIVDGANRLNSKLAVAIAHGFVGFSGLQGAVFNAAQRQSPMLVIISTADSQAHTGETHMYADVEGAAKAARVKYVKNATDPATLLRDFRDVIIEAMTPPFGPVVFIVGSNVAGSPNTEAVIAPSLPNFHLAPPLAEIERLAEQILKSDRPAILIGDGVSRSGAQAELLKVAELLGSDIWASMESEVNFPRNHPLFRGSLGHMYDSTGHELLKDVDFVVAVGTPVYQTVFNSKMPLFQPGVPIAAINQDIETTLRGHNDITLPIKGDPKRILEMLLDALGRMQTDEQVMKAGVRAQTRKSQKESTLKQKRVSQLAQPGVTMAKFANLLEQGMKDLPERPIIFNEALEGSVGLTDYIENINIPGKYFDTSGGSLGEWAGAVGAAMIGRQTIAFIGDGGFNYTPQALWNAARENLPLGLVVANNAEYGLLYSNMNAALVRMGIDPKSVPRQHYYELPAINHVKIGEGYGIPGMRVENEAQLQEAVGRLLEFKGPFLVDLILANRHVGAASTT